MARMRILTDEGVEFVEIPESEDRSTVGDYWNAVRQYLRTGDDERLASFEGEQVAPRTLLTDLDHIDELARAGELEFEDIYEL